MFLTSQHWSSTGNVQQEWRYYLGREVRSATTLLHLSPPLKSALLGFPLIGNLLDIPPFHSWLKFKAWADIYGDIYALNLAGRLHVVISNERIANELLRERGNIYSSREQLPMAAELLSDNLRPLLLPYNGASLR